jgi:four helix bundle protein
MQDFQRIQAWQHAHALTLRIYFITASFSLDERFGITAQLRRACSSIGANIAEGSGRGSDADFCRFLQIATGSTAETENFVMLSRDLNMMSVEIAQELLAELAEVKKKLINFMKRLR